MVDSIYSSNIGLYGPLVPPGSFGIIPTVNANKKTNDDLFLPFLGTNGTDYSKYLDGDIYSTFKLFEMMLNDQIMFPWMMGTAGMAGLPNFNTKSNLPALKDVYNPDLAGKLAGIAYENAIQMNSVGHCAKGATNSIIESGQATKNIKCASAYQVGYKLANNKNFREIKVSREDLKNLPAGCVIVWEASPGHEHGHIAITLGNGKEASDHVQNLITNRNANFSVYVPVGNKKLA